jgi:2-oxoglutarate ferredoxin oxidoreductase subunit gamma
MVMAGRGGQGVLFVGRLLAEAGLLEGREVLWLPSYGGQKRGGPSHCTLIISDERIGTLFVNRPTAAIALSEDSFAKVEPTVKPGGLFVINQSLVTAKTVRQDIRVIRVPANDLAAQMGDSSVANLVALGVCLAECPVVSVSTIVTVMDQWLAEDPGRAERNRQGLSKGYSWAEAHSATSEVPATAGR